MKRIDPDRLGDILELRWAKITDREIEPTLDLTIGVLGQTDRPRLGDAFKARGDIDAVAHQVAVALLDDVADVDADAELDAAVLRHAGVALDEADLHFDRAANRVDHAAKLDENTVAGALDDAPMMGGDGGVDQVAPQAPKTRERAILIRSREPAVADDIGDQDRRNFPGLAHRRAPLGAATLAEMPAMIRLFWTRRTADVRIPFPSRAPSGKVRFWST